MEQKATIKSSDMRLADTIQFYDGAYGTATVKKINEKTLLLYRPYVITQDFSYTGGVICSVAIEEITIPLDETKYVIYARKNLA